MNESSRRYHWIVCLFMMMALIGCVAGGPSQPSRFYALTPLDITKPAASKEAGEQSVAVGVGPVEIPEYLNRAQIVTRLTENELKVSEFDRWAEPLNDNFTRVLAENLSDLCADPVMIYPWRAPIRVDFKVEISIIRFDGNLGKDTILIVLWGIFGESGDKLLVARRSVYTEPLDDDTYATLVKAQSRVIATFSRDIAGSINDILKRDGRMRR
jgi:uncharacterized lipoprotein YmbA